MEKKEAGQRSSRIQSVERALTLLEIIAKENTEMTLTELSLKIGLPKSTVYGLLATLRDYHYVDQSPETGRYKLGIRLFELGSQVSRSWAIRDVAHPVMQRLCRELGETVQLGTEESGAILYLEKIAPNSLVSILSEVGTRLPMHCSGLGKVLLAQKTPGEMRHYISQNDLIAMTKKTITSQAMLEKELEKVRNQKYAVDDEEIVEGLRCVAAPIWDWNGEVRYAISVSGQVSNMSGNRLNYVIQEVKQAAEEISYAMGNRKNRSSNM